MSSFCRRVFPAGQGNTGCVKTRNSASPGSPILADGFAVYTPGLSERRGGASRYYTNDQLGNLWTMDTDSGGGTGKAQLSYQDTTGFGSLVFGGGDVTPFKFGGGNGCQTDADTGLVLMGHRYFDSRTGRFINQDPAGDGDNWYAYADNDPGDEVDPEGLIATDQTMAHDLMMGYIGGAEYGESGFGGEGSYTLTKYTHTWQEGHNGAPAWEYIPGSDTYSQEVVATFSIGGSALDLLNWLGPEFTTEKNNPHEFDKVFLAVVPRGGTYLLRDPKTDKVMRTGRAKDFKARRGQHAKNFPGLDFEVDRATDNYAEQRGREQMIQDLYKAPLDKIRGISWKNPRLFEYLEAAVKFISRTFASL